MLSKDRIGLQQLFLFFVLEKTEKRSARIEGSEQIRKKNSGSERIILLACANDIRSMADSKLPREISETPLPCTPGAPEAPTRFWEKCTRLRESLPR